MGRKLLLPGFGPSNCHFRVGLWDCETVSFDSSLLDCSGSVEAKLKLSMIDLCQKWILLKFKLNPNLGLSQTISSPQGDIWVAWWDDSRGVTRCMRGASFSCLANIQCSWCLVASWHDTLVSPGLTDYLTDDSCLMRPAMDHTPWHCKCEGRSRGQKTVC